MVQGRMERIPLVPGAWPVDVLGWNPDERPGHASEDPPAGIGPFEAHGLMDRFRAFRLEFDLTSVDDRIAARFA